MMSERLDRKFALKKVSAPEFSWVLIHRRRPSAIVATMPGRPGKC